MQPLILNVPFAEKDAAKALGARWNPSLKKWFVPAGLDPSPFAAWFPAEVEASYAISSTVAAQSGEPLIGYVAQTPAKPAENSLKPVTASAPIDSLAASKNLTGISLASLLHQVQTKVALGFPQGVWTLVEVMRVNINKGHVYLEISERMADGQVLAMARGMIWANMAAQILPEFERKTGVNLAQGIKLLVLAQPTFHPKFGLSLEISAINADYTLGDLEAKKKQIRQALQEEGIFTANQQLPPIWDFNSVLVISPEQAAGLGDFQAEAEQLEKLGLCRFIYTTSRFQGEAAATEILASLRLALARLEIERQAIDALVILRGGGAVNDLAWLNDYELARALCLLPFPVLTGIGHERDSTILDEVAYQSYSTPSKVIAGIKQLIVHRALEIKENFNFIDKLAKQAITRKQAEVGQLLEFIQASSQHQIASSQQQLEQLIDLIQTGAEAKLTASRRLSEQAYTNFVVLAEHQLASAHKQLEQDLMTVRAGAEASIKEARALSEGLFREIAGQGPAKTLSRGFTLVRDSENKPVTNLNNLQPADKINIEFKQGKVSAEVTEINN